MGLVLLIRELREDNPVLRKMLIVQTPDDVRANVLSFPKALQGNQALQDRLSYARAWYAVHEPDGWVFAPSKWAGYSHMTAATYLGDTEASMDGRKTEKYLQRWFTPLDDQSPEFAGLRNELTEFVAEYGKQPSASFRISVISDDGSKAKEGDNLVDLLVRVVQGLGVAQKAKLKAALRL
jgi:hypothetical protein